MTIELSDVFFVQLAMQAQMYPLRDMADRRVSAQDVAHFFRTAQRDLPVTATVEVGAHEAEFSCAMARLFPGLKVFAYEANPHVYARCLAEGELTALGGRYEHCAIADTDGTAPFYLVSRIGDSPEPVDGKRQSLLPRVDSHSGHSAVTVPCARLDSLFGGEEFADDIFSLWIDAEGAQGMILAGAEELLRRTVSIYIEVESMAKWADQKLDRDILALLLQRDFVPLLRDFQFPRQYNMVLVRKDMLPLVERRLHNHVRGVARRGAQSDYAPIVACKPVPAATRSELPIVLENAERMLEVMTGLPLLRPPRDTFDPKRTVVACHASELEQAIAYYAERYNPLPVIYVEGAVDDALRRARPQARLRPFGALRSDMDVQLFFLQAKTLGRSSFMHMAHKLQEKGFSRYGLEGHSTKTLWRKKLRAAWSREDLCAIQGNYNALTDPVSRHTYLAMCRAYVESEPGYMPIADYAQYYHPQALVRPGDVLCEGGIWNGETTQKFYEAMRLRGTIFAFEPVPHLFQQSSERLRPYAPAVHMVQKALWSGTGTGKLYCDPDAPAAAYISEQAGNCSCECTSIDEFFVDKGFVHAIKLDVEGAELPVLQGAVATLYRYKPKLMISIYHQQTDYITVLQYLRTLDLGYRFYVGHHRPWFTETVLYGVAE